MTNSPPGGKGSSSKAKGNGSRHRSSCGGSRSHFASSIQGCSKFQGACEALKDYIFDCSDHRQADCYANSLKRISEYVGSEYKNGGDIQSSVINETKFTVPTPTAPTVADPDNPTPDEKLQLRLHEKRLDAMVKREGTLDDNIQRLYSLVLGQCTDLLQTKLKQQADWNTVSTDQDGIELLKMIKTAVHRFDDQKYTPLAHYHAKSAVYALCQGNLTNDEYLKKFNNLVDVAKSYEGQLHDKAINDIVTENEHPGTAYSALNDAQKTAVNQKAHELFCATIFLAQCNKRQYGKLLEELENGYTRGQDGYPSDMVTAFKMINEYKCWQPTKPTEVSGTAFTTRGRKSKPVRDSSDTDWHKDAICHECGKKGHIQPNCPDLDDDDNDNINSKPNQKQNKGKKDKGKNVTFAQDTNDSPDQDDGSGGFGFCNTTEPQLDLRKLILLDNQSTVDIFCNQSLVQKIWKSNESMTVKSNGGSLTTMMKATVKNYGEVWFDERAITNILCVKNVRRKFPIEYDCYPQSTFYVKKHDGTLIDFVMHPDGLHYHDTRRKALTLVNTVTENEEGYTKHQLQEAKTARELQATVGSPST